MDTISSPERTPAGAARVAARLNRTGGTIALGFALTVACASGDAKNGTAPGGSPSASTAADSGGPATTTPDASASTGSDAPRADGSTTGSDGPGEALPSFLSDGATADARCAPLDIAIVGNPGSNPSSNFQQWLTSGGATAQRIQTDAPTPEITAATLQPFDVVILDQLTRDYTAAEAAALATWMEGGGGVVSLSGYQDDTTIDWYANSLLAPMSVAYSGTLMYGPVTQFTVHPITAGIASITFDGGYGIADLGGSIGTRTPIAFLPNPLTDSGMVPVGYAIQLGAGRAFVWGDEWIEFDSAWSSLPQIKQLWVQVFGWLAPTGNCVFQPPQ